MKVATLEQHMTLEERVRKLELRSSLEALNPTGIVALSTLPCGSRKARRLADRGKLPVFRIAGGRRLYCRVADFVALAEPVLPKPKTMTASATPAECIDAKQYAEQHLSLLKGRRAA